MPTKNETSTPAGVKKFKSVKESIKHVAQVLEKIHSDALEKAKRKAK